MSMKATPDSFVFLAAAPWGIEALPLLEQVFVETWVEELRGVAEGEVAQLALEGQQATVVFDEPIPELTELTSTSLEPYAPTEVALLGNHTVIWRVTVPGGKANPKGSVFAVQLMSALIEAGVTGIFLPLTMRLHSPRTIRRFSVDPENEEARANLLLNCWDQNDWMRSRGLTAFGLPELETPIADGANAAYFRIMDVAANMIAQNSPFPNGGSILAGPHLLHVKEGPQGPSDERIPFAGHFGVQTLIPDAPRRLRS